MNKPIQIISRIKEPNLLLNKFIMFRYKNHLSIYYIYKIEETKLFACNMFFSKKVSDFQLCDLDLEILNRDIKDSCLKTKHNMFIYIIYVL